MFAPANTDRKMFVFIIATWFSSSFTSKPEAPSVIVTFSKLGTLLSAFIPSKAFTISAFSKNEFPCFSVEFVGAK